MTRPTITTSMEWCILNFLNNDSKSEVFTVFTWPGDSGLDIRGRIGCWWDAHRWYRQHEGLRYDLRHAFFGGESSSVSRNHFPTIHLRLCVTTLTLTRPDNGYAGEECERQSCQNMVIILYSFGFSPPWQAPYFWQFLFAVFHMYLWRRLLLFHISNLIFVRA